MLMQIQDTVIRYAEILSQILKVDIGIADSNLKYVAATGSISHMINMDLSESAYLFKNALETGETQIIKQPRKHKLCWDCKERETCKETFEMNTPIMLNDKAIGVIGLTCFTEQQRSHIIANFDLFLPFMKQIAEMIALKVQETEQIKQDLAMTGLLEQVFENVETGAIVLDSEMHVLKTNRTAKNILHFSEKDLIHKKIALEMTGERLLDMQEYKMSVAGSTFMLFGKKYDLGLEHYEHLLLFNDADISNASPLSLVGSKKNKGIRRIIGSSEKIEDLRRHILMTAASSSTVFIVGEEGTDRRNVAVAIYEESERAGEPMLELDCTAVPPEQIDDLLFGNDLAAERKGKVGLIEQTGRGSLFIAEVTYLPLPVQYKLFQVLTSKKFMRNNGKRKIECKARFLFSGTPDIYSMLAEGTFRKDLFYKMNVMPIEVPPLRERKNDIRQLAENAIRSYAKNMKKQVNSVDEQFWEKLQKYEWPGNNWELQNTIEYAVNMMGHDGVLRGTLLTNLGSVQNGSAAEVLDLKELERSAIARAAELYGNDKRAMAKALGISLATLYRKLDSYKNT